MEQNFHIFYYLYDSLEAEGRLDEFHLSRDKRAHHRYLNNSIANNKTAEVKCAGFPLSYPSSTAVTGYF